MTTRPEFAAWAGVVPDDDPPDLVALARLQILNTLLLAKALHERRGAGGIEVLRYEAAVLDPAAAHAALARLVPEAPGLADLHGASPDAAAAADDTFATTTGKTGLTAGLDAADAEEVARGDGRRPDRRPRRRYPARPGTWPGTGPAVTACTPSRPRPLCHGRRPAVPPSPGRACPVSWVPGRSPGVPAVAEPAGHQ